MPLSFAERLLAPYPHAPVSVTFERLAAGLVLGVDLGHELVEVELAEGVARAELHRLGRVPLPPRGLLADDDPGGAVRVEPIYVVDAGGTDGFVGGCEDITYIVHGFAEPPQTFECSRETDGAACVHDSADF